MNQTRAYECSASGCAEATSGHYCDAHRALCGDCAEEFEVGSLVAALCARCAGSDDDGADDDADRRGVGLPVSFAGVWRF